MPGLFVIIISAGHVIVGSRSLTTVTTATHVLTFPIKSVTDKVTLFGPTSLQSKSVCEAAKLAIPQLSEEPPSISAAVIDASPLASSCTVMSLQTITSGSVSLTVTSKLQVVVFPLVSVTKNVLVVVPTRKTPPLAIPAV